MYWLKRYRDSSAQSIRMSGGDPPIGDREVNKRKASSPVIAFDRDSNGRAVGIAAVNALWRTLAGALGGRGLRTLALIVMVAGCSAGNSDDFVASGKKLLDAGDSAGAIIQFKNALQKQPENGETRYLLGAALSRSGSASQAVVEFRKAVAQGYDAAKIRPELLAAVLATGDFKTVVAEAITDGIADPNSKAEVLALAGDALIALRRRDEAIERYGAAAQLNPDSEGAGLGQVTLDLTAGKAAEAKTKLDALIAKHPNSVRAHLILGGVMAQLGDVPGSAKAFDKAIDVNPSDVRGYLGLIPALIAGQDIEGAKKRLAKLESLAPTGVATSYLKALIAYSDGKKEVARELVRLVVKAVPDDLRSLMLAGSVEFDLGNYALAENHLAKVAAQDSENAHTRRLLAMTRLRMGNSDNAWAAIEPVVKSGKAEASSLAIAGEVAGARRDHAAALTLLKRAVDLEPKSATYRAMLGQAQLLAGDRDEAINSLNMAIALDPKQHAADVTLITYYTQSNKRREAADAAEAFVKRHPESPIAHSLRGATHLAGGDEAKARAAFEKALSIDPGFESAGRSLAQLSTRQGKPEEARKYLESVLSKRPSAEATGLQLAQLQDREGAKPEIVLDILDKLIAAAPASEQARIGKIQFLLKEQRVKDALEFAQKAVTDVPDSTALLLWLARVQLVAKESSQAITTYGKLIQRMPTYATPLLGLVAAHSMDKNWNLALDAARKAVALAPESVEVRLALVSVGTDAGRFAEAREDAKVIQKKWPKRPDGYAAEARAFISEKNLEGAERTLKLGVESTADASLIDSYYDVATRAGHAQEAERVAGAWLTAHPKDAKVALKIADGRLRAQDFQRADAWYSKAASIEPDSIAALNNWAWVLGKLKDPRALAIGRKALEKAPKSAAVLDTVGMLHAQNGEPEKGLELLRQAVKIGGSSYGLRLNIARVLAMTGKKDDARIELDAALKEAKTDEQKQEIADLRRTL